MVGIVQKQCKTEYKMGTDRKVLMAGQRIPEKTCYKMIHCGRNVNDY